MNFRFVSPALHGILDYTAAAGLIVFPFLLGLGEDSGLALWLSVGAGALLIGYSLVTDYAWSAAPLLSFDAHLALDLGAGTAFFVAPFIFSFGLPASIYYFVMAAGVLAVVAFSQRVADAERPTPEITGSAAAQE